MKVALPNNGQSINQHFGRSTSFVIARIEEGTVKDIEEVSTTDLTHKHQGLANFLLKNDVKVVITGGIGAGALSALEANGLEVIKGAAGDYKEILDGYIKGTLVSKDVTCGHHHGHHHHDD